MGATCETRDENIVIGRNEAPVNRMQSDPNVKCVMVSEEQASGQWKGRMDEPYK